MPRGHLAAAALIALVGTGPAGAAFDADAAEAYVGEHSVILFVRALAADAEGDAAGRDELLERVVELNEAVLAESETLGSMSGSVYEDALELLGR